ncbi:DUF410-domain-containing protein, partial [Aureobasidium melanogenum]
MWIPQNRLHRLKITGHLLQAILTFITGCMTLAILTEKREHDSRVQWCFALCFLTMPALMYQCIVPCWTRLWRLANPYIFFAIDSVFTIFWMSAFASMCAWTAKGIQKGAIEKKLSMSDASCSTFAFGSTSACNLAKATTGLGVALCILFLAAAVISGIDTYTFWKSGNVRTQPDIYGQTPSRSSSPEGKDEWSLSTDDLGAKSTYASDAYQGWAQDHEPAFLESDTMEGRHPGKHVRCETKIQKTLARQQEKVKEGQFYEAHQQLRVIASRYTKSSDWTSAIDLLASGASMLLKAGQGASGGDLCMFLMDVYGKAELKPDTTNKARLLSLLREFPEGEPTRKRFAGEVIGWSSKFGEYPAGDPELHHVIGTLYAEDGEATEAEKHLTLGTADSPATFASLEYEWYASDEPSTAPLYAARVVFPYLLVGNLRAANKAFLLFTSKLSSSNPGLGVQEVGSASSDLRVYPSLPLLNFLGLLLLAIEKGSADVFKQLKSHYASYIKDAGNWDEALAQVGEMYFGIKIPSQSNPLFDMMSSFMGGGGSGGQKPASRRVEAAPAPALD